jgi:hypothetical protein
MAKHLTVLAVVGFAVLMQREANQAELVLFGVVAGCAVGMVRTGPRGRRLVEGVAFGYLAGLLAPVFDMPLVRAVLLSPLFE